MEPCLTAAADEGHTDEQGKEGSCKARAEERLAIFTGGGWVVGGECERGVQGG